MNPTLLGLSKAVFILGLIGVVVLIGEYLFLPDEPSAYTAGCYWDRGFIDLPSCRGFWGAPAASLLLNIPYFLLVFGPLIFLFGLIDGSLLETAIYKTDLFLIGTGSAAVIAFALIWPVVTIKRLVTGKSRLD